ncbi:uncharacterized protein N7500_002804 [Penicillium coprophilum]|uniref:uncharacterized protein n=1 Tax=Penicillium coprophilum TaxID=36646 RepID=UPI00239C5973|nr:uncharacterized protein N7500_002804 [Penicillium coprophilum]KAJ5170021.1 hypothetical protein N7500_002804 [Penicillium coprophilum]
MTPNELRNWLEQEQSQTSGWVGNSGRLSVMKDLRAKASGSGRRIVRILEHNPAANPSEYSDQDIDHMRRVVSYCKRHLAQEERAKHDTSSKSYRSLKNWGHDALKE